MSDDSDDGFQTVGGRRDQRKTKKHYNHGSGRKQQQQQRQDSVLDFPPFLHKVQVPQVTRTITLTAANFLDEFGWTVQEASVPCMLLLVGLPGSGKSTFSTKLQSLMGNYYVRINQDELKSRSRCLEEARRVLLLSSSSSSLSSSSWTNSSSQQQRRRQRLVPPACPVIDRCHISRSQRAHFLELAAAVVAEKRKSKDIDEDDVDEDDLDVEDVDDNDAAAVVAVDCIWFQTDPETCKDRCLARRHHPTLPPSKVPRVMGSMLKEFQEPRVQTEGFRYVRTIHNPESFVEVLQLYVNRVVVAAAAAAAAAATTTIKEEEEEADQEQGDENSQNERQNEDADNQGGNIPQGASI